MDYSLYSDQYYGQFQPNPRNLVGQDMFESETLHRLSPNGPARPDGPGEPPQRPKHRGIRAWFRRLWFGPIADGTESTESESDES